MSAASAESLALSLERDLIEEQEGVYEVIESRLRGPFLTAGLMIKLQTCSTLLSSPHLFTLGSSNLLIVQALRSRKASYLFPPRFAPSFKSLFTFGIDGRDLASVPKYTFRFSSPSFRSIILSSDLDWAPILGIGDGEDQIDLSCQM